MIYTITINPALDYYVKLDSLTKGVTNRSLEERYEAAGKGVNVSKFLNSLAVPSKAMGFLGGMVKERYLSYLDDYLYIEKLFTGIADDTRINVKIHDDKTTSLNASGPKISDEEFMTFTKRFKELDESDFVILSGSVQDNVKTKVFEFAKEVINSKACLILDTDNNLTEELIKFKPYLIKLGYNDIGIYEKDIIKKGKELISKDIKYVLYSSPFTASYLFEKDHYFKCEVINPNSFTTGINDAMIAGFVYSKIRGGNSIEAFKSANTVALCISLLDLQYEEEDFDKVYNSLEIEKIEF